MGHFFKKLKYSYSNEDSSVERASAVHFQSILSIAGSGSRAFSLVHPKLKKLVIVDSSPAQIEYTKFKWELIQKMNYSTYLKFMGYHKATLDERLDYIEKVELSLPSIQYYRAIPENSLEEGIVFSGRWESRLISLWKFLMTLTIHDFRDNFNEPGESQIHWPARRLRVLLGLAFNPLALNQFLFSARNSNRQNKSQQSVPEFFLQNIEHAFLKSDPKNSFFHQMLFLGQIEYPQGHPIEISEEIFNSIKNYTGNVEFHVMDIVDAVKSFDFEFGSFSRVPSTLSGAQLESFESALVAKLKKGCRKVIMRSFCYEHRIVNEELRHKLNPGAAEFARHQDSTGLYRFQIIESL